MWLYIAIIGFAALAVVAILDKFIVSEQKISPLRYAFYSSAPLVFLFLALPFGVSPLPGLSAYLLVSLGAVCFVSGLWSMFIGYAESEVSHIGPLIGAGMPFFILVLGRFFLSEQLSDRALWAVALLIIGSLLISFEFSGRHNGWHRGMAWGLLSSVLFSVFQVIVKHTYLSSDFFSGFVWLWGPVGACGALLALLPSFRRATLVKQAGERRGSAAIILTDKALAVAGLILVQYAVSLGSVTVVNALSGVQYGLLVILVAILSKFFPKLFREEYKRGEAWQEAIAVVIIGVGLAILIM